MPVGSVSVKQSRISLRAQKVFSVNERDRDFFTVVSPRDDTRNSVAVRHEPFEFLRFWKRSQSRGGNIEIIGPLSLIQAAIANTNHLGLRLPVCLRVQNQHGNVGD